MNDLAEIQPLQLPAKRKAKKTSPTQRSLAEMRKRGYKCAVVEHWNPHVGIRQDLFGVIDVLCLGENEIIGVQCTSGDHVADRCTKIADHENTPHLRKAGMKLVVHGWRKNAEGRWVLREVDVS